MGWLIFALWSVLDAKAHDDGACPPPPVLRAHAEARLLPPPLRACADADESPAHATIRVLDDLARPDAAGAFERATAWLGEATHPEDTLLVAERARERAPDLSRAALEATVALSPAWTHPQERARQVARVAALDAALDPSRAVAWAQTLAWLGVMGPPLAAARHACAAHADAKTCAQPVAPVLPAPRAPTEDDLRACLDLGAVWRLAYTGPLYASERDCVVRALDGLEGEARRVAGHLALLLARRHRDREGGMIALHRVAALLDDDPVVRATIAAWRDEAGDPTGAAVWRDGEAR